MLNIKNISDPAIWEKCIQSRPEANFLHSYAWGEFQASLGNKVWRLGLFNKELLIGLCQFYLEKARRGPYFACPGGPLINYENIHELQAIIAYIRLLSDEAWFFRCRPQLANQSQNMLIFRQCGFRNSPMHMSAENTWQIDLSQNLEDIMKNMRKNTRRSIKQALSDNHLRVSSDNNISDIDQLYQLQIITQTRHKFVPFNRKYLKLQFKAFQAENAVKIFKATYQGNICAMAFVIFYNNEAVYHYAASNELAQRCHASYLIEWAIIQEAKNRGMIKYNLWGVVPDNNSRHRFWGVSVFKKGFGGELVQYLPAQDLPLQPWYFLTRGFEFARKKIRRL